VSAAEAYELDELLHVIGVQSTVRNT
jgi:hypothetical protein